MENPPESQTDLPSPQYVEFLREQRRRISEARAANPLDSDGAMASSHYQNGLLRQLDNILSSLDSGKATSADFEKDLIETDEWVDMALMAEDMVECPAAIGHQTVLNLFCTRSSSEIPPYYCPGDRAYDVFTLGYWEGDDSARTRARSRFEQSGPSANKAG